MVEKLGLNVIQPTRRQMRFTQTAFVVFVAGYYAFQNIWLHLLWFGCAVAWPWVRSPSPRLLGAAPRVRSAFLRWAAVFGLVMWCLALRPGAPKPDWLLFRAVWSAADIGLLLFFLGMAYRLGRRPEKARRALEIMIMVAAITAAISVLVFYGWLGHTLATSRLENVVVHFGLAPVLTGLLYGFAGLAAAVLAVSERCKRRRRLLLGGEALLLSAALCTHSRGAMLALAVGFGVLLVLAFRRQSWPSFMVFVLVALGYFYVWPQWEQSRDRTKVSATGFTAANPANDLVRRKDGGRVDLYRTLLERMKTPTDHILGRGTWADDQGPPKMSWAQHPHSAYLATYYRGGAVGLGLLGIVVVVGGMAGWRAARRGQPWWLVLASFGVVAFLFDGDSLVTMMSLPRMEPLLFWFPLAAGAGAGASAGVVRFRSNASAPVAEE